MMSYVIGVLTVLAIVFGVLLGRTAELSGAALSGGVEAVKICLELLGAVAMWNGIMRIAEKSGLCEIINRLLVPVTGLLFRGLKERSPKALSAISLNIAANLLGLGAAATPMALDAMTELDRLNGGSAYASDYMVVFVALNTASFQILPTTVATLRSLAGSASPMDILPAVWVTSAISVAAAVGTAMLLRGRAKGGGKD
jgi:spore maturation protein A